MVDITDRDWWLRHVDMRCRVCGETSVGSDRCRRCYSTDVELRTHVQTPVGENYWCKRVTPDIRSPAPAVSGQQTAPMGSEDGA